MRDRVAVVPAVAGRVYIIGLHKFVVDDEDPFKCGFDLIKSAGRFFFFSGVIQYYLKVSPKYAEWL